MDENMDSPAKDKRVSDYTGRGCIKTVIPSKFRVGEDLWVVTSTFNEAYLVESRRDSYQPTDIEQIDEYYSTSDDIRSLLDLKEVTFFSPEQLIKKNEFLKNADPDKYVQVATEINQSRNQKRNQDRK